MDALLNRNHSLTPPDDDFAARHRRRVRRAGYVLAGTAVIAALALIVFGSVVPTWLRTVLPLLTMATGSVGFAYVWFTRDSVP